jgi:serine/threonine-protein kinase
MSYCPECGEKIANDDVFCPYCGITLKPTAPVEDSSLSETIVDMSPVAVNKEALDALAAKSDAKTPKIETQNQVSSEKQEAPAPVNEPENAIGFSAGDTSENWAMKTESVEIPAENLEEIRSVPLPTPFGGDDEPIPATDIAPPVPVTPPTPFEFDELQTAPPVPEKSAGFENIDDVPKPAIFEEPESNLKEYSKPVAEPVSESISEPEFTNFAAESIEPKRDETEVEEPPVENKAPESFEPVISEPISAPFDFSDDPTDSPAFEEPSETVAESLPEEPQAEFEDAPFEETPKEIFVEPVAEVSEPPIVMPDMPLVLENQEEPARFDSVQIIQKNEIEESRAAEEESKTTGEQTPADEKQAADKAAHSSTTPIVGNTDTDGRKTAKLKPLDEGTILNSRYEIVRKIGGGGMGAVYLANDRNLGGVLRAVKEMVQSYIESEQQDKAVSDFKRESLLLSSLDHSSIPTIYDYFFDDKEGRFYLVMKYISGGDLASRLRAAPEGRLDEKTVTEWAIQIADVLDYLHNHEPSIVYRDLKPANVMIDGNSGRVMLIDFGIARWVNKEEKGVTAVGTMGYAPPELFSGNVEPRSDIYSLGSTMFHLLTGADPQSNPLLIFDFQKNPRPRQINSQLSDQIEQILLRSVEYSAEARFTSAAEMRDALKEHLQNLQMGKVTFGVKVAPSNRAFSEQAVFCGFCGKQIVATDVFCAFCGAQQPIAQHGISHPSIAVQPMTAKLVIQGTGELEPSSFRLEKSDNLLGRRDPMSNIFPEVDLSKYDPQTKISRRHARIWREGNSFLVEDLGSSNGTTLLPSSSDSVRLLPHQPHTLTNGDKIKLGDTTLHFTIG